MKENKGKEISEGKRPETQPQDQLKVQTQGRLTTGDRRKSLPKNLDLEGLPSRRHCFQNRTGPGGRTVKTGNRDENRFFKPKEPDFLLIP